MAFHVVMARNYIENLREEVKKGMREKAEQGIYPSRPPVGYRNNKLERTIEVDPEKAPLARRMFELYATGKYSLSQLRMAIQIGIRREDGEGISRQAAEKSLLCGIIHMGWQDLPRDPALLLTVVIRAGAICISAEETSRDIASMILHSGDC